MDWKHKPYARQMVREMIDRVAKERGISIEEAANSLNEFMRERVEFEEARKQHQKDGHSEAMARLLADLNKREV